MSSDDNKDDLKEQGISLKGESMESQEIKYLETLKENGLFPRIRSLVSGLFEKSEKSPFEEKPELLNLKPASLGDSDIILPNGQKSADMSFGLSNFAIKRPASIFIVMFLIIFLGFAAYKTLPRESAPDIQIPILIVTIPYPGSSPQDVEALIIHKLEIEFQGLESLKKLSSTATEGAGIVTLEFVLGVDIDEARAKVREALDRVGPKLPSDAEDAIITEINLSERPIMIVNLSGKLGLLNLKNIAEDIKEEIESIHGILEVKRAGGLEREVKIQVDPEKLRYYNLDLNQVSNAISSENSTIPAGDISLGSLKYMIRVPGEITSPDEIKNMVIIAPNQVPIFTKDVAIVDFGFKELTSRSRLNGLDSISLSISKRSGENLIEISDKIKEILEKEKQKYSGKINFVILTDESKHVRNLVSDLENNIYSGLIFVLLVLLVVMGIRNAVFIATAIPFSMLLSFMILDWVGITLNFVVLFSLILALGMLVDNAIVIVENIYRHVEAGMSTFEASKVGVGEVAIPVITSTLTTLAAFVPLLFMPDISGEFMSYLPKTLIITLSSSLFVGLIINPVLCSTMMRKPKEIKNRDIDQMTEEKRIVQVYRRSLMFALNYPWMVVVSMVGLWVLMIVMYFALIFPDVGVEFFPSTEPNQAVIHIDSPFGSTLETSDNLVGQIENKLTPYYEATDAIVANVGQGRGGSGSGSSFGATTHLSHVVLSFPDWQHREIKPSSVIKDIRSNINELVGAAVRLTQPKGGPPTGKPISIEISGKDPQILKEISLDIQKKVKDVEGLVNLIDDFTVNRSEIQVRIDKEKTARLGLRTSQVAGIIRTAFNGRTVSTYRVGKEEYDIVVRLDDRFRNSINSLESLYLKTPAGQSVSLGELAEIKTTKALGSIRHVDSKTVITVSADAEGYPGPVVLKKVQERLTDFEMPRGYALKYAGENEHQKKMQDYLAKSFFIAVFLIFLILVTQFNSLILPFIILTSVFLSLIGVFMGMIIHSSPVSVMMGGIGVISLAGVVVNNAIVLIDYINQLRSSGMECEEAIVLAGMRRLRPVLLTAITTILGLLPITLGMDINFYRSNIVAFGSESGLMWVPMARSVIYGLSVATILTLILVPVLYLLIERQKQNISEGIERLKISRITSLPLRLKPAFFSRLSNKNGETSIEKLDKNKQEESLKKS
ncbi:MAG: efflux RND transporter permease subunit [Deltaproteobacteria bacterium]|nr:efflux RND transporter permease subunit [Deltaproteobacteria bacterium]